MIRRSATIFVISLCLLCTAALAQPNQAELASAVEHLDIDWEASSQLIFLPLVKVSLEPGTHEAQVRIHDAGQPLFFEQVSFEIDAGKERRADKPMSRLATPLGLQILSYHPEERAWLLEQLKNGAELGVEIQLNGGLFFEGSFANLVAKSDRLREQALRPLGETVKFADLRKQEAGLKLCVDDCYDDYAECQVDFCYWEYDAYMCNTGCDLELDDCLAVADPVCQPPTCTPGVVTTDTNTVLIGTQPLGGLSCWRDIFNFNGSVYYIPYQLTYQTTTRELRRNADCSTQWVTIGTSTFTSSCYSRTGLTCSFGFIYPSCVF